MITIDGGTGKIIHNGVNIAPAIMINTWRINTTEIHEGTNGVITSNWEEIDNTGYGKMGSSLTNSSGVFSFPSTGIYYITSHWRFLIGTASDSAANVSMETTTDNSTYADANIITVGDGSGSFTQHASGDYVFDVVNTSTHKFRWRTHSFAGNSRLLGDSGENSSYFTVIRMADT